MSRGLTAPVEQQLNDLAYLLERISEQLAEIIKLLQPKAR